LPSDSFNIKTGTFDGTSSRTPTRLSSTSMSEW
jgi:hypothetical protein